MHTHVITTTTSKLHKELEEWQVASPNTVQWSVHHMGGRDWVLVLQHTEAQHRPETPGGDEPRWNPELRSVEDGVVSQEQYLAWALRERFRFWNQVVSARTALQQCGWPDAEADEPAGLLMNGIYWLRDQKTPPREITSTIQTRDVVRTAADCKSDHAVYIEIDGRNYAAAGVETCNGGGGLLLVAPSLRDTDG